MNSEKAISWFENRMKNTTMPGARAMFSMALSALREQQERENPKPLTLDELRQMDGYPVYIHSEKYPYHTGWRVIRKLEFGPFEELYIHFSNGEVFHVREYGTAWVAYRHKPKEVQE